MPNYCENALRLTGKKEKIEAIKNKLQSNEESFYICTQEQYNHTKNINKNNTDIIVITIKDKYLVLKSKRKKQYLTFENIKSLKDLKVMSIHDHNIKNKKQLPSNKDFIVDNILFLGDCNEVISNLDWSIKNWGTKWDAIDSIITSEGINSEGLSYIDYFFLTAYEPPCLVYKELVKDLELGLLANSYEPNSKTAMVFESAIKDSSLSEIDFEELNEEELKEHLTLIFEEKEE